VHCAIVVAAIAGALVVGAARPALAACDPEPFPVCNAAPATAEGEPAVEDTSALGYAENGQRRKYRRSRAHRLEARKGRERVLRRAERRNDRGEKATEKVIVLERRYLRDDPPVAPAATAPAPQPSPVPASLDARPEPQPPAAAFADRWIAFRATLPPQACAECAIIPAGAGTLAFEAEPLPAQALMSPDAAQLSDASLLPGQRSFTVVDAVLFTTCLAAALSCATMVVLNRPRRRKRAITRGSGASEAARRLETHAGGGSRTARPSVRKAAPRARAVPS